jgi:hypothetical protein
LGGLLGSLSLGSEPSSLSSFFLEPLSFSLSFLFGYSSGFSSSFGLFCFLFLPGELSLELSDFFSFKFGGLGGS